MAEKAAFWRFRDLSRLCSEREAGPARITLARGITEACEPDRTEMKQPRLNSTLRTDSAPTPAPTAYGRDPSAQRVADDVEDQLLAFYHGCSETVPSHPPPIGIERGVARGLNDHARAMAVHRPAKHPEESVRVIHSGHDDNGFEAMLVAPHGHDAAFVLGAVNWRRNLDRLNAKRSELSNRTTAAIVIGETTSDEFVINAVERIGKDRHARCDSVVNEISSLEDTSTARVNRDNDDVGGLDVATKHEHVAGGSKNGMSQEKRRERTDGERDRDECEAAPTRR